MTTLYHCLQNDEVFSSSHSLDEEEHLLLQDFLKLFSHKNYVEITLEDTSGQQVLYSRVAANQYVGCRVGVVHEQLCSPFCTVFGATGIDSQPQYYKIDSTVSQETALAAKKMTQQLLKQLCNHKNANVRATVEHLDTPAALLEQLAYDEDIEVRRTVAKNDCTPTAALTYLATEADNNIRCKVATNNSTPASVLKQLAADADSYVRGRVASNAGTPIAVLEQLATDEDCNVRWWSANNANAPRALLAQMATDENTDIRWRIAANTNTPVDILERLAMDEDRSVRGRIAENPNTSASVLECLAVDQNNIVRWYVATNTNTPTGSLERLSTDEDSDVRLEARRLVSHRVNRAAKLPLGTKTTKEQV